MFVFGYLHGSALLFSCRVGMLTFSRVAYLRCFTVPSSKSAAAGAAPAIPAGSLPLAGMHVSPRHFINVLVLFVRFLYRQS